jgi:RNA polymerase sigma factor (sigma-70 family)
MNYGEQNYGEQNNREQATNAELVRGALAGDSDSWDRLVRRHNGSLYYVTRSFQLDKAAAEDAVQTTWLRLVEHLGTLREPDRVGAWLVTTIRRHIISTFRGRTHGPHLVGLDGADVPDPGRSPEDEVTAGDRDARMRAALRRLPARDRQLLTLLMASRRPSYGKVSAELRMPIGSIGPTRARCLARLRRELEADGVDEHLLSA